MSVKVAERRDIGGVVARMVVVDVKTGSRERVVCEVRVRGVKAWRWAREEGSG